MLKILDESNPVILQIFTTAMTPHLRTKKTQCFLDRHADFHELLPYFKTVVTGH